MKLNESPIYNIWRHLKAVCENQNHKDYYKFGGKGIIIHKPWREDFKTFYNWSLNNGYKEGKIITRLNLKINFTPENSIYLTKKQNWFYSRNKPFPNRINTPLKLKKWSSNLWEKEIIHV